MAIAFVRGTITRDPYFRVGETTPFAACTVKETYTDKSGKEQLGGYHDVVAFGEEAQALAALGAGSTVEVKASVRYRPDKRFVGRDDESKNPFLAQFVVMEILNSSGASAAEDEEDPFGV